VVPRPHTDRTPPPTSNDSLQHAAAAAAAPFHPSSCSFLSGGLSTVVNIPKGNRNYTLPLCLQNQKKQSVTSTS
jgi:hypothetical protein